MALEIAMPESGQQSQQVGAQWTDKERVNDLLSYEKYLTAGYNTGLCEMQNPRLHQPVQRVLNQSHDSQAALFDCMFRKGWYKMKAAEPQEIAQARTQCTNDKAQFPQF